ncbi:MAG: L-serine ammonia-lyase, iron-sulfur-dependent, subunit alpha [Erysipelotrichaceae bacterium]|nr:L-serine ammonia-lyase, iron-sulfur-dependent, subunit alpha [Erysipelotrichaceae bacterium]
MESLRELYRIGPGPSSSHSLGVRKACEYYYARYPERSHYTVELYGSLSLTGKGHMTDKVIYDYFGREKTDVVFMHDMTDIPNTMRFYCDDRQYEMEIYSVGGGAIAVKGLPPLADPDVYPENSLTEIASVCRENNWTFAQYVYEREPDIRDHLKTVKDQMVKVIKEGLTEEGYLPGILHLEKVAKKIYRQSQKAGPEVADRLLISSYAYAAMEESSSGKTVVTAPTLGSSGIISALVMFYTGKGVPEDRILEGLAVAGIVGNVVKKNASISGAVGGCQAEIGTACAMGAAMASHIEGLSNSQIEYAAEVAMEHNLGLTCDPVGGYVQIPCIERNGVAVLRSLDAMEYAKYIGSFKQNRVSFDMVVSVMKHTGKRIPVELRETSMAGLAIEVMLNEEKKKNAA